MLIGRLTPYKVSQYQAFAYERNEEEAEVHDSLPANILLCACE